jgi:hypothetical protein
VRSPSGAFDTSDPIAPRGCELWLDVVLYGASAAAATVVALVSGIPLYRRWGWMAVGVYAGGAVAAVAFGARTGSAVAPGPRGRVPWGRPDVARIRSWLALAVLIGSAIVPLAVLSAVRSEPGRLPYVQSEVIVTEEAAKALLDGRDPYAATFLHGPLVARPLATKTHFPYLPGMVAFGVPRALDGRSPASDARVWFAAATLGVAAAALLGRRRAPFPADRRLLAFGVLAVLPTGALLMATGGDDVPVAALMLLALVLLRDDRPIPSGLALGVAMALKQTAWLLAPFLVLVAHGRDARTRMLAAIAAVVIPVVVPFVVWNPAAFVEDAIRFPLGLGAQRSAAGTPTLGSVLIDAFPGARTALVAVFVAIVVTAAIAAMVLRRPRSAAGAAAAAGVIFGVALLLAPSARLGYVIYPIDLLVWAFALRSIDSPVRPDLEERTS